LVWGGENRVYAGIKFFIFTMVGSVFMLFAILMLPWLHYGETGVFTTDLLRLYTFDVTSFGWQAILFLGFSLALAIKIPLFPFHTWLPDAHTEAPTGGSVILAGILLKVGAYGFLRFAIPLFPAAAAYFAPWFIALGIFGIIYGALVAMIQPDIKRLVAYSSVSHMGYIVVGMFALTSAGVTGSILQMINHGLATGALFLLVGVIYERRHTRLISEFGGLAHVMPKYATIFMIVTLSSIALPGLNGFVGEFMILLAAFSVSKYFGVFATFGAILGAAYMLWMYERVFYGPVTNKKNEVLEDLTMREILQFVPILILFLVIGLFPSLFTSPMESSVEHLVKNRDNYILTVAEKKPTKALPIKNQQTETEVK
jgi:NADH-quinone oxidoreductase subunit M